MKFGSLFAGIGGLDLGLERAGMQCTWQVEIDDYCRRVLAKHWPEVKRYSDVRECGAHNLAPVDLICGGFPCQPHSVAGKRRGKGDDRDLWPEYRRIIGELRPRWVLGENVPGIITTMLDEVLSDLESEGYICTTLNLPACAFDAPHRRARIFIVAYAERNQYQSQVRDCSREAYSIPQVNQPRHGATRESGRAGTIRVSDDRYENVANANSLFGECDQGWTRESSESTNWGWWPPEPNVGRVADGVPRRVDRLRALGNAVVPQVAEWIGNVILALDNKRKL